MCPLWFPAFFAITVIPVRQLNGEKIQITVKFDHDRVVRNPTNSICFLLVGASAMEVTFPVSHMKTYEDFKNVFRLAFFIGQVFGKP